jgi:hypothetical protein
VAAEVLAEWMVMQQRLADLKGGGPFFAMGDQSALFFFWVISTRKTYENL